jgi:hypothetical protein
MSNTNEPFTAPKTKSKTGGNNTLFNLIAMPFAAIGGVLSQIGGKFTRKPTK